MPSFPRSRWEEIVEAFYDKYRILKKWQDDNYTLVCKQGFLQTFTGRKYVFNKVTKWDGSVIYNKPDVCNYPVQGTATADIMPLTMLVIRNKLLKERLFDVKIINQVHDSIILDAPKKDVYKASEICYNIFQDLPRIISRYWDYPWTTPMTGDVKYGTSWGKMEKVSFN